MESMVTLELTAAQAHALQEFIPRFADIIEGEAVAELRPMDNEENIAHSALCWLCFSMNEQLKDISRNEIRKQYQSIKEHYKEYLRRQAKEN